MIRKGKPPQFDFGFRTPRRKRKKKLGRPTKVGAGVAHAPRAVKARDPLHVTLRMKDHVWQLRSRRCFRILERAFYRGCDRFGSRLCHFSVQHNHVHMIVETSDARALARAIQGMAISMAKRLNRLMSKKGAVFADRYHSRTLRTPSEVRRAIVYVLGNAKKHLRQLGYRPRAEWIDAEFSSALWFGGWAWRPAEELPNPAPVVAARTWLLREGYLRAGGRIGAGEEPRDQGVDSSSASRTSVSYGGDG